MTENNIQLIKSKRHADNGKDYYNYYIVVNGFKIAVQPVIYKTTEDKRIKYINLRTLDAFAKEEE